MKESKIVESKIILKQNMMPNNAGTHIFSIPKHNIVFTYIDTKLNFFLIFLCTQIANDMAQCTALHEI